MQQEHQRHHAEPEHLDAAAAGLVQQQDRDDVAGHREHGEDAQLDQRVVQQRGVRVEQLEDLGRGDGVAVVAEVEQRPAASRADQPQQHAAASGQDHEAAERGLRVPRLRLRGGPRRGRGAGRGADRRLGLVGGAARHREPGRLVDLPAQVEHGQAGDRAEAEQDPPGEVVRTGPTPSRIEAQQRADDEARRPAWRTPGRPSGRGSCLPEYSLMIVARDRVVAADADAEDDPADEQERVVRRERRARAPRSPGSAPRTRRSACGRGCRRPGRTRSRRTPRPSRVAEFSQETWPVDRCHSGLQQRRPRCRSRTGRRRR